VDARNKNPRKNVMKLRNKYYIMRHGQAISNVRAVCSCWPEKFKNPLTILGEEIVRESAEKLKAKLDLSGQTIDLIFSSDLLRTKQTSEITGKIFEVKPKFDKRLREINFGIFNNGSLERMWKHFKTEEERIRQKPPKGESYVDILYRMESFLKETNKKYKDRNILIISSEGPLFLLQGRVMGLTLRQTIEKFPLEKRIHKGEIRELN
jgi:broad specificity phosphatase PhoE